MIKNSVGRGGRNISNDTRIVQQLLNNVLIPGSEFLVVDGLLGVRTVEKILAFQRSLGVARPTGLIDPNSQTITELMCRADKPDTITNQLALSKPQQSNTELGTPWIDTAMKEDGVKEVNGLNNANPRIMEYHKAAGYWAKDDTGELNAWCASFVSWVMQQHGHTPPRDSFRVSEWKNFGNKLSAPAYGAIGIKSRAGGGHTAFIIGQSKDGKRYYMLGGNQGDKVCVREYPASGWDAFVFPSGATPSTDTLPVYKGNAAKAGSEA